MKKIVNIILLLVFFVLAFTFAQKNQQVVDINYYADMSVNTQMYMAVFASLAVGLILGYLISMSARMRTRGEMKKAQREAKAAQSRLDKIKASQELTTS